jgi:flagellar basal-body rod protein FlgG
MERIFAVALQTMHNDQARVDRIAVNLANVSTPGYKREVVGVQPFGQVLEAARPEAAVAAEGSAADGAGADARLVVQVRTDVRPGTVKVTGQPLDLALEGDGFFEVMTEAGPAYTRQGDFRIDGRGRVVTAAGHPVMGAGGEIVVGTVAPAIDEMGNVTDPSAAAGAAAPAIARVKVVRFAGAAALQRLGDGLVAAGPEMTVVTDGSARIRQGALENANVSSMQEMVQLIQTMRHFESMQKVVQGYDELLGMAIRKLGDLT